MFLTHFYLVDWLKSAGEVLIFSWAIYMFSRWLQADRTKKFLLFFTVTALA